MAKSLRRIAQLLTTPRDLLREHAQMIREAEHVLEDVDCADEVLIVVDAGAGECFDEPECTHAEGTFTTTDSCLVLVEKEKGKEEDVPSSECSVL